MGAQIAQQAALHGIEVWLTDKSDEQLAHAVESNRGHLERRVEKGKLAREDADAALARVRVTPDLAEAVRSVDFVIEAVFEDLELKRSIFAELDRIAPPTAVLASNSSSSAVHRPSFGLGWTSRSYSNEVAPDRRTLRTVFRDTFRSRAISLIVLPLMKCSRRIRATVSTTSIP